MILVDSCVFIAYANTRDVHHKKALKIMEDISSGMYGKPIFSDYIFSEVVTVMLLKTGFNHAKKFGTYMVSSEYELFKIDERTFEKAWKIFCDVQDMSFVDCTNLALMERFDIKKIATFDKGFLKKAEVIE
jgi:predicted nucleic acid-binding protein